MTPGQRAQRGHITLNTHFRFGRIDHPAVRHGKNVGFVDACGPAHLSKLLLDDGQRVTYDNERQRNLQAHQYRPDLASTQRPQNGKDLHAGLSELQLPGRLHAAGAKRGIEA